MPRKLTIGIVAHANAGKTTITEALLYNCGALQRLGRVDKKDAFLDTHEIERERGITIFSKQARMRRGDVEITLIDTPGHVDFASEAERVLGVLDACILVVGAPDGVRAHTQTLWHLLAMHRTPVFLFVNKTDIAGKNQVDVMNELRAELDGACANFTLSGDRFFEETAGVNEAIMQRYFDGEPIADDLLCTEIALRRLFPVYFGAALKNEGVGAFLDGIVRFCRPIPHGALFGAKVYKIAHDPSGARLTYLKVTGGTLRIKQTLSYTQPSGEPIDERVEQIRLYSGDRFVSVGEVGEGEVCAVLGPKKTFCGLGLGVEPNACAMMLEPILSYTLALAPDIRAHVAYERLLPLAEEDPTLHLVYDDESGEIRVQLMGEIQSEILKRVIAQRFGLCVELKEGKILYKETITAPVFGAGHFEPLRHYAEVHLLLEPLPAGSGLVFESDCSTDRLPLHWQRLVLTHLEERVHRGVLIGAPIADMKITLIAGRAHNKHTEGGDFRQATYRAVRQGLMKAQAQILEPYLRFAITLPTALLGRAMTDLSGMSARLEPPEQNGECAHLRGVAPASTVRTYPTELRAYTRGEGSIQLTFDGYDVCHDPEAVMAARLYDPLQNERDTPNSVFCKNGAGYVVPWDEADGLMHVDCGARPSGASDEPFAPTPVAPRIADRDAKVSEREWMAIYERTYGKIKPRTVAERREYGTTEEKTPTRRRKLVPKGEEYLLVDGYNVIHAWEMLRRLASESLDHAREALIRMLCNYTGYRRCQTILVFDAYRVRKGDGGSERIGGITVVYTKERQTADAYIERTTARIAEKHDVRVVTADGAEQLVIFGAGAYRMTPEELYEEMLRNDAEIERYCAK